MRDVATMKVRGTAPLDLGAERWASEPYALRCDSADGRLAQVAAHGGRIISVTGGASETTWTASGCCASTRARAARAISAPAPPTSGSSPSPWKGPGSSRRSCRPAARPRS